MFKRLFIKLPLYVLFFASLFTIVIPLVYWLITGEDFTDFIYDIEYI
jgi:hypothetical protein